MTSAVSGAPSPNPSAATFAQGYVPSTFYCPITHDIMTDPVVAADGFTYDRHAIEEWFDGGHRTSPMTNESLENTRLVPNRTLRAEIANGRTLVALGAEDLLEMTATAAVAPSNFAVVPPPVLSPVPCVPGVEAPGALSMPPRYEDYQVLIPNLQQHVNALSAELSLCGLAYKSAAPHGRFAVVTFLRRLTAREAHGAPRYERLSTVLCDDVKQLIKVGDSLRLAGWSYTGYELRAGMMVARFRRRCAGAAPQPHEMAAFTTLVKNDLKLIQADAARMRRSHWSFESFGMVTPQVVEVVYKRPFLPRGSRDSVVYEQTSRICENDIDEIFKVVEQFAAQGWGFDRWEVLGSVILHFKRPTDAKGNHEALSPVSAVAPLQTPRLSFWRRMY